MSTSWKILPRFFKLSRRRKLSRFDIVSHIRTLWVRLEPERRLNYRSWSPRSVPQKYIKLALECDKHTSAASMGLYHPLDGVTNLKYKLLYFLTSNKKIKE